MKKTKSIVIILTLLMTSLAFGQEKKHLTYDNLLTWETIKAKQISDNGRYIVYETSPTRGDFSSIIYNTETHKSDTLNCSSGINISPSESFLLGKLKLPYDSLRQKMIAKVPSKKMPKDSIIIYNLNADSIAYKLPQVKTYKTDKGYSAAILLEKTAIKEAKETPSDSTKSKVKPAKQLGDCLVIYNGISTDTTQYKSITEYTMSTEGNRIAFIQAFEDSVERSEVFIYNIETQSLNSIYKGDGNAKKLCISENGEHVAYIFSEDSLETKNYNVYYSNKGEQAHTVIDSTTNGMPFAWNVSENTPLYFNKNASRLILGTAEIIRPSKDTIPKTEIPGVEVWSWKDLRLQTQQNVEAAKDLKKTYRAVYQLDTKQFSQIADSTYDKTSLAAHELGTHALLTNGKPYQRSSNWTARWSVDVAVKNIETGKITPVVKDVLSARISPQGQYVIWYNDKDSSYYAYSIKEETTTVLNSNIPYPIYDEANDRPMAPSPYGIAGWSKDDKYIFIYDKYDVWKVNPKNSNSAVCLTSNHGRKNNIKLRYIRTNYDIAYIPNNIYLLGHQLQNNKNTYFTTSLKKENVPSVIINGDYMLGRITKARNTDHLIWSKQTVNEYPDIRLTSDNFKNNTTVSHMNPQQEEYNWATVETMKWNSFAGEELNGLVYKPENFDPKKKYPVMFYFYELNFDTQHRYFTPSPSRSIINRTLYASNEYIVVVPDITYTEGQPGKSAYDAIVSMAQTLKERYTWIDGENMALSGQSWGGYQTAYLITQTNIFKAAMAGAPVSNMTSAYGGIRWGSGASRMFQYERTQSRLGGTLWDKPMYYIENSPLFYAPKVETPLLIMHNDHDTAVPWYQGIEFFMALRRLEKPVWMLNYKNEPHNLKAESVANRLDLSMRMMQFFNHYLKNESAPVWMTDGIPATERKKNLGY